MDNADRAVDRAIECLWQRYGEQLSLTEIARPLSRAYFARRFRDATGVSPGRFLAAVRVHQAKRLLLSTSLSVTDISYAVGCNSIGSFTSNFTETVGIAPGRFRRLARDGGLGRPGPGPIAGSGLGSVAGTISLPAGHGSARVYVGAFRTPIVQHPAAAGVVVDVPGGRPSCYTLPGVPAGTWVVRAVGVADGAGPVPSAHRTSLVGRHDAVVVVAGSVTSAAVRLRGERLTDPPVLLALPELEPLPAATVPGCPALAPRTATV